MKNAPSSNIQQPVIGDAPIAVSRTARAGTQERLRNTVASQLKSFIMEKGLRPGDRLPTEQELADMFGVSRICMREATKSLSFIGVLDSAPKRGLTVSHVDMERITEYLSFHFALNDYPMEQLLKTRIVLESGAFHESAQRVAEDDALFNQLMSMVDQHAIVAKSHDVGEYIRHDVAFHHTLLEASGIEPLLAFSDLVDVFFCRFRELVLKFQKTWSLGVEGHRNIVLALRSQDINKATQLLREHLNPYRKHL